MQPTLTGVISEIAAGITGDFHIYSLSFFLFLRVGIVKVIHVFQWGWSQAPKRVKSSR